MVRGIDSSLRRERVFCRECFQNSLFLFLKFYDKRSSARISRIRNFPFGPFFAVDFFGCDNDKNEDREIKTALHDKRKICIPMCVCPVLCEGFVPCLRETFFYPACPEHRFHPLVDQKYLPHKLGKNESVAAVLRAGWIKESFSKA